MFADGFLKVAFIVETGVGALAGGERGKDGNKKHRSIGAARGFAAGVGGGVGSMIGIKASRKKLVDALQREHFEDIKRHLPKVLAARIAGYGAGGLAGYHLMKKYGPKYDKEMKSKK